MVSYIIYLVENKLYIFITGAGFSKFSKKYYNICHLDGFDRTAAGRSTRAQISQDLAKAINDGLNLYEDGLWLNDGEEEEGWINCTGSASDQERTNVNVISQEDFEKIKQTKKDTPTYYQRPPAPPPIVPNTKVANDSQTYNNAVMKSKPIEDDLELEMQFQVL